MSKLFLIDAGHGGIHPMTNQYVTPGKRSPEFPDGSVLYEGVNNRINAKLIVEGLRKDGLNAELLFDTWQDVPLSKRVKKVNEIAKEKDVVLISIHSDAFGKGWTDPKGITVFTSKGHTKSDIYADHIWQGLNCNFADITTMRTDRYSDGDVDKESQFYILTKTSCPAILLELGFHTNKQEATLMQTDVWRDKIVKSLVEGCNIIDRNER